MYESSSFFTFSPALSILFITAILVVVKWCLPQSWFLHMEHPPCPCLSSRVTNLSFKQYLLQKAFFVVVVDPPKPQVIISFFKFFKTLLISLVVCFFPYVAFFCVCILSLCYNILVIFESLRRYSEARREEGRL